MKFVGERPNVAVMHQGRLWFAGISSRPLTLWASSTTDIFDFNLEGPINERSALEITIRSDPADRITSLRSSGPILLIETRGWFYLVDAHLAISDTITPYNIRVSCAGRQEYRR